MTWYSLRVEPAANRDEAIAALFGVGAQGVHEDGTAVVTSFPDEAAAHAAARAVRAADPASRSEVRPAPSVDWSLAWRDHVRAVSTGRLTIAPPWLADGLDPARTVLIEPGMAFGTGDHGSTRGAARLLEQVVRPGDTVADLGSGSGVLSIAAARLGASRVWAIECDPDAQDNAAGNVRRNGVEAVVHLLEGDAGILLPLVAPVDGIVANIVSSVILDLLPSMATALAPRGWIVLAGIMASEQETVVRRLERDGWSVDLAHVEESWWSAAASRR